MISLKEVIINNKITEKKLKEFGLDIYDLNSYVDVGTFPNQSTYTNVPNLVAKNGKTYNLTNKEPEILTSSSQILESDSTTTLMLSSSQNKPFI
ncbi:uncharacterized protein KGF55_004537 [Candida pseudojiufengensis]|uniref:uncharacterized protein n=1 Tax=Candida pseudojiufengensis TaxID=497109 RepID=UPI00222433BB|nr:uncharacterized protein KGF55_004537 [Candida pseudojiufengensis]KAI5960644.1 hypothetical protein KGF55_004537 [Candida pseudojiufengensis]